MNGGPQPVLRSPNRGRGRRALRGLAAWLCAALVGAAHAQDLRLAVSVGPVSLPVYVAEARGFFVQEGVAVRLTDCASGRACFEMLRDGKTDLATAAELLVALGGFQKSEQAIVATLSASSRHIKLVARRGAGVARPGDLQGKRVATVPGTSAQYFLDSWLVFNEIDPASVRFVPLPPDRLVAALQQGEVDAVAIWEPVASAALAALASDAVVLPSARVYTQHFSLVANRSFLGAHPAAAVSLLRALERAERHIAEQPGDARAILAIRLRGEPGLDLLGEHVFKLTLGQSLVATLEGQARWARRQHLVRGEPGTSPLQVIDPAPLREAVPGAVSLVQ